MELPTCKLKVNSKLDLIRLRVCSSNAKSRGTKELRGMQKTDYKDGLRNLSWKRIKGRT